MTNTRSYDDINGADLDLREHSRQKLNVAQITDVSIHGTQTIVKKNGVRVSPILFHEFKKKRD